MQHGSLQNQILGASPRPGETTHEWSVGDGATTIQWTDRTAHTVVDVVDERTIKIRECRAIFRSGSMGTQVDRYEELEDGEVATAKLGAGGWRTVEDGARYSTRRGYRVVPGRNAYHDPSF